MKKKKLIKLFFSLVNWFLSIDFFFQDGDNWRNSHVLTFSGIDSSYSLPDNVAIITLQVLELHHWQRQYCPFFHCFVLVKVRLKTI